ncbi:hypothetical protein KXV85_001722, partial [Aspergillus fumigatus]
AKIKSVARPDQAPIEHHFFMLFTGGGGEALVPVRSTADRGAVSIYYAAEAKRWNRTLSFIFSAVVLAIFSIASFLKVVGILGGILLFWWYCQWPSGSGDVASRQALSVKEEKGRIVLGWSGPVQEPMSERVAAALDRYKDDQRRLVLVLNSLGGSIEHGRKGVAAIHARNRPIDTLVEKDGVCASMCVPIFLAGAERMADPDALFMFHQACLNHGA